MSAIPIKFIPLLPHNEGDDPASYCLQLVDLEAWDAMPKKKITQEEIDSNPALKRALECPMATEEQIAALEDAMRHTRGPHYEGHYE